MKLAFDCAKNSKAKRLKVGAIVVNSTNKIIGTGKNRMPRNYNEICEHYDTNKNELVTNKELIHAEEDAIGYCAECGKSTRNATIFITDSPCLQCAKLIYSAGIKKVVYCRRYRISDGLLFLEKVGVEVKQINFDYNG